jgi:hypothetical protein
MSRFWIQDRYYDESRVRSIQKVRADGIGVDGHKHEGKTHIVFMYSSLLDDTGEDSDGELYVTEEEAKPILQLWAQRRVRAEKYLGSLIVALKQTTETLDNMLQESLRERVENPLPCAVEAIDSVLWDVRSAAEKLETAYSGLEQMGWEALTSKSNR